MGWSTNADIIFLTFQSVSYFRHLNCYVMATMYLWTLDYILNNIQLPYHFFVTIIHSFTLEINKIIWKIKAAAVTTPRSHHHHQGSGQDQNHPVWRDFPRSDLRRGKIPQGRIPQARIPQERKRRGNCFQCGRPCHIAKWCRMASKKMECWKYGGAGHTRNVCPSKGFKSNKIKEKKEKIFITNSKITFNF